MFFLEEPAFTGKILDTSGRSGRIALQPISMASSSNNPHEWQPLIEGRLIDYIRVHSVAGGRISVRRARLQSSPNSFGVKQHGTVPGCLAGWAMPNVRWIWLATTRHSGVSAFNERTQAIFQGCRR